MGNFCSRGFHPHHPSETVMLDVIAEEELFRPFCINYPDISGGDDDATRTEVCSGLCSKDEMRERFDTPTLADGQWWLVHVYHHTFCISQDDECMRTALEGLDRWQRYVVAVAQRRTKRPPDMWPL